MASSACSAACCRAFAGSEESAAKAPAASLTFSFALRSRAVTMLGMLTSTGTLTWPVIRDLVERVFTVTDDEIRAAMRLVWERNGS